MGEHDAVRPEVHDVELGDERSVGRPDRREPKVVSMIAPGQRPGRVPPLLAEPRVGPVVAREDNRPDRRG
jgi:hypothetical protein